MTFGGNLNLKITISSFQITTKYSNKLVTQSLNEGFGEENEQVKTLTLPSSYGTINSKCSSMKVSPSEKISRQSAMIHRPKNKTNIISTKYASYEIYFFD